MAALDALTVMETIARAIPTTATTNTYKESTRRSGDIKKNKRLVLSDWPHERVRATITPCPNVTPSSEKRHELNGSAHQDVKSDKDGAGGKADLGTSWRKLPHQEHEEDYIRHQQQQVPKTHPETRFEDKYN